MAPFIISTFLFLLSLLILFRAPTNLLWYVSILVTEFCWIFVLLLIILICLPAPENYQWPKTVVSSIAIIIFLLPILEALRINEKLPLDMALLFPNSKRRSGSVPFRPLQMLTGIGSTARAYQHFIYDEAHGLSLHFYPSVINGERPCVIVIHGGSWAGGNNLQLPDLNSKLALEGYHVASIHYRLAPKHRYPCQLQDVKAAIDFLTTQSAALFINPNAFTLLGRSAGGQIALSAAYALGDPKVKAVIAFYAPADMIWGYSIRCSPLVLDSRKVMEDYLGGSVNDVYDQYHQSSPTETVTSAAPPTLLFYAEHDPLVSPRHGDRLTKKLQENGVNHLALNLPWATHGFDYTLNGPAGQLSTWAIKEFLKGIYQSGKE